MQVSIIIPVLNEENGIIEHLQALQYLRPDWEIIVVDGASTDNTRSLATPMVDALISSPQGRAVQMNAGARVARHELLLFLHADTFLPCDVKQQVHLAIQNKAIWGRFNIFLSGFQPMLKVIAFFMNWRSRLTGICTGDQVIFIHKQAFHAVGQFEEIALMEDINISKKLNKITSPYIINSPVSSSGRRWEKFGCMRTILLMWSLRLQYFFGRNPAHLALLYKRGTFWKA